MKPPAGKPILLLLEAEERYSKRQLALAWSWCTKFRPGRLVLCEPPEDE